MFRIKILVHNWTDAHVTLSVINIWASEDNACFTHYSPYRHRSLQQTHRVIKQPGSTCPSVRAELGVRVRVGVGVAVAVAVAVAAEIDVHNLSRNGVKWPESESR